MTKKRPKKIKRQDASLLDKSSDYYLHLIENSRDIFYIIDTKTGKFEYVSPSALELLGFTPKEILQMGTEGMDERTHPDDLLEVRQKTEYILAGNPLPSNFDYYVEKRIKHKAGHYVWLGINRKFIPGSNGRIEKSVGNIHDITGRKQLTLQLEQALDNYKTLYNNARVALYRVRISDGKMLECNEMAAKILGYENREQCLAEHYSAEHYVHPKRRRELLNLLTKKKHVDCYEVETRRPDGSLLWIRASMQMYPEKGYLEGAIWDITASKLLTPVEKKILEFIMQGKSSKEIAFQLKRSIRTVEDHRAHIMQKLGANNLVELTKKAIDSGIEPQEE
ncbi:MAG: PAS domain S-box protein [Phycisphaerae bacterium]|nr:PAS domain S-box protein [Phycisphaerae bacterium]